MIWVQLPHSPQRRKVRVFRLGLFLYGRRTGPARTGGPDKKAGAAQPPHFSPVAGASPARGRGKSVRSTVNPHASQRRKVRVLRPGLFFVRPPDGRTHTNRQAHTNRPARHGPFLRYLPAAGFIRTTRVTSYTPAYCAAKPSSEGPASTASSSASTSAPHFSPPVTRSYSAASTPVRSTTQ